MQTWSLIVDSFRHTRDGKMFWVMLCLSLLIAAAMACIGFDQQGLLLFFNWRFDDPAFRAGTDLQRVFVAEILTLHLVGNYIGFAGVILSLISTAGILPDLMRSGAIDVVLAKPMGRFKLFLGKYLGSMSFVLVQSAFFVTLTFLVAGLRWKQWLWPYFWSIPLAVVLFSYIYVFVALFAVLLRSTLAPVILGLACWFAFFLVQTAAITLPEIKALSSQRAVTTYAAAARWAVPRTGDISIIAARLIDPDIATKVLGRASFDDVPSEERPDMEFGVQVARRQMSFGMVSSLASSLAIEAVILLLAMWRFSRRDF